MMVGPSRLATDRSGAAAAEMALTAPLLLAIMLTTFEIGNYYFAEHAVQKAVRDAARYAGRLSMSHYPSCTPTAAAQTQIQRVARTGDPNGSLPPRVWGWTSDSMTVITMSCDTSGTYTGVFTENPQGAPKITVAAQVPYVSLFGAMGLPSPSLTLNARSQAAGFGA